MDTCPEYLNDAQTTSVDFHKIYSTVDHKFEFLIKKYD